MFCISEAGIALSSYLKRVFLQNWYQLKCDLLCVFGNSYYKWRSKYRSFSFWLFIIKLFVIFYHSLYNLEYTSSSCCNKLFKGIILVYIMLQKHCRRNMRSNLCLLSLFLIPKMNKSAKFCIQFKALSAIVNSKLHFFPNLQIFFA